MVEYMEVVSYYFVVKSIGSCIVRVVVNIESFLVGIGGGLMIWL